MNYAIVLAGGTGTRMGANIPKQFIVVKGKPVLAYTLEAFAANDRIDGILLVSKKEWIDDSKKIVKKYKIAKVIDVIAGGEDRRESSRIGVEAIASFIAGRYGETEENTIVLIHDAARPFVIDKIIEDNIDAANKFGAAETAIKITDTVARATDGILAGEDAIVPRENLYRVQTPQSFRLNIIKKAHRDTPVSQNITDDAMLALHIGVKVHIVEGDAKNIKITTPDDLKFF